MIYIWFHLSKYFNNSNQFSKDFQYSMFLEYYVGPTSSSFLKAESTKEDLSSHDDLYVELKKYGIQDLYNFMMEKGVSLSMLWTLTKQETKEELGMPFGQEKRYWIARQKREIDRLVESGRYGKSNEYTNFRR